MQKIKKSIYVYLIAICFSVFFYQCCTDQYKITGAGELTIQDQNSSRVDTITGAFFIFNDLEFEVASHDFELGIINSTWATSCEINHINPIDEETIALTLSNDIEFNGELIPAGSNILDRNLEGINTSFYEATIMVIFSSDFLDNASIPNGAYTLNLSAETADQLLIQNEISTVFAFN